ncbi:stage II sporulation protein R [Ammoniphilus oxalaticus]|uniref:Stage II sporulation protein R n=1 Tax=Ammoniphilus oxalaticus TaxID=66863 RepID=A0A419SGY4_9BACL|nr:stage II sporulation protein R [Ammoniphilus oxalaticus]RKD23047.1 stage II sporulation protein R [Ammoniphilus oxalaticus]
MRKVSLVLFSVMILVMSWENQKSVAALFSGDGVPEQSIRLRIIANSDAPQDQILKRKIRDNINNYLADQVEELDSLEQARQKMHAELPALEEIVEQTVADSGFTYESNVELGVVPFPTKMYGQYVYPAGDYEALRVTVGEGRGQNWWCVLFPPLCFVDITTGDAVKKDEQGNHELADGGDGAPQVQVKFFLFEIFQKLWKSIFG